MLTEEMFPFSVSLLAATDTFHHLFSQRIAHYIWNRRARCQVFFLYLSAQDQNGAVDHLKSCPLPLKRGIPQGFVPGPVLLTLYVQPLSNVISQCACNVHKYNNNTKPENPASPSDFLIVLKHMEL